MDETPAESVRKSPGFLDFKVFINFGIVVSFKYFAAFKRNAYCSACLGPGTNFMSVPILVLIGGTVEKSM